jgi:hypothetical protein
MTLIPEKVVAISYPGNSASEIVSSTTGALQLITLTMVYFTLALLYIKYIFKTQLNDLKEAGTTELTPRMRWAKRLTTPLAQIIMIVVLLIEQCVLYGILLLIEHVGKKLTYSNAYIAFAFFAAFHAGLCCLAILAAVIYDLAHDYKKQGGLSIRFFTERDPLNYRIDAILLFIQVPIALICVGYILLKQYFYGTAAGATFAILHIATDVIWRGCFIVAAGFSCIITIVWRLMYQVLIVNQQNKKKGKTKQELMQKFLERKSSRKIFSDYCQREFSTENLSAWDDIEKYLDIKDPTQKLVECKRIYEIYVNSGDSTLEVNIPTWCRQNVVNNLMIAEKEPAVLDTIYDEFQREVLQNLLDTFSRFSMTSAYTKKERRFSLVE